MRNKKYKKIAQEKKQLEEEKAALQFTFDQLNMKIKKLEVETQNMRNNMNAVHGAIQQVDKLMNIDYKSGNQAIKDELKNAVENGYSDGLKKGGLEIKEKEDAQLLNEGDK